MFSPAEEKGHVEEWGEVGEELEGEHLDSETLLCGSEWSDFLWWRKTDLRSVLACLHFTIWPVEGTISHTKQKPYYKEFQTHLNHVSSSVNILFILNTYPPIFGE